MKITYIKAAMLFIILLIFSSCEEKLETEFGNSNIYFSATTSTLTLKNIDVANLEQIKAEKDTVYQTIGVYRSGVVNDLEEITVSLAIDSAYLDSVINVAQTTLPANMTDLMKTFINSKALGGTYFSVPSTVTIPKGDRRATVPLVMRRSLIKLYNNANFNYSPADLASATVPKDKKLVLPIKITATTSQKILETQNRYYFQILKTGDLK